MTTQKYYMKKTAPKGSSLYYSLLYTSPQKQKAIIALHAFYNELTQSIEDAREPGVVQLKLAWWQQEIERLFTEQATHPITQSLQTAVVEYHLPKKLFNELIMGASSALFNERILDENAFNLYCYRHQGILGVLSSFVLGLSSDETLAFAHDLGISLAIVNRLLHFRHQVIQQKMVFPQSDLDRFHIKETQLSTLKIAHNIRHFLKHQASRARKYYLNSLNFLPAGDRKAQRHLLILGKISMIILDELETLDFELFKYQVDLTPLRKFWIAMRTR